MQVTAKYSLNIKTIFLRSFFGMLFNFRIMMFLFFLVLFFIYRKNESWYILFLAPILILSPLRYLYCHIKYIRKKELIFYDDDTFQFGNKGNLISFKKSDILELQSNYLSYTRRRYLELFISVDIVFKDGNYIAIPNLFLSKTKLLRHFKGIKVEHEDEIDVCFKYVEERLNQL